jgi:subtilisin family serine protease
VYGRQWNMKAIRADSAWAHGKLGSDAVTIAILDTGIDYDNPDLNGLVDLSRSTSFVPTDDAIRDSFFAARDSVSDFNGHGTNVAAQASSKATYFAGVTSKTKLMGVKVLGWNGVGASSGVVAGIIWAADHGANIANMSLGIEPFSKSGRGQTISLINRVFNYAKQKGMLIVVAAGNAHAPDYIPVDLQHNGNEYAAYCDAPHVICVAAVGPLTYDRTRTPPFDSDLPAWYSYYGRQAISVAAPGGNYGGPVSAWPWGNDNVSWIWSLCSKTLISGFNSTTGLPTKPCAPPFIYAFAAVGTSQASPHVAGLAASLMAETGILQPQTIKRLIEQSSEAIDPAYGRGRINVKNALGL